MNSGASGGSRRTATRRTGNRAPAGRRRTRSTPDRLTAAARALFARHGYDGASVRAITRDAHANLGAVTYHFGTKQALYEAVLEQGLGPLAARVEAAAEGPGGVLDRAEATVRAFLEHLSANPDLPQLMLQEISAGRCPPAPVARILGVVSARLAALVQEGQTTGEVRAGDPRLLGLSLLSQPVHLTLVRNLAHEVVGLDQSDPETRARVVEHAARFARGGLAARKDNV